MIKPSPDFFHHLRLIGNIGLIISYFYMLNKSFSVGIKWKIVCTLAAIPSLIILHVWDGVLLSLFFVLVELYSLKNNKTRNHD